jgi:hypothetical protein
MRNPRNFPPYQDFSKYVFVKEFSDVSGLRDVSPFLLKDPTPLVTHQNGDTLLSEDIKIPFRFKFGESFFDKINVSINGFLILRKETDTEPVSLSDYFVDGDPLNLKIKQVFSKGGALLCPWFSDLKSTQKESSFVGSGATNPGEDFHFFEHGVQFFKSFDPKDGNCFSVRWRVYSAKENPSSILRFEASVFQNGRIKFSYAPAKRAQPDSDSEGEKSTIGVFLNSDGWKFRDFSDSLSYAENSGRQISDFGGFYFNDQFSDNSLPYANALIPVKSVQGANGNWPCGEKSFCTFSFLPPQKRRKILPKIEIQRISSLRSNNFSQKVLVDNSSPANFNDRKTVNFSFNGKTDAAIGISRLQGDGVVGIVDRQNIFGDLVVPAIVKTHSLDQFFEKNDFVTPSPFFDIQPPQNSLFLSGLTDRSFDGRLKSPTLNKTQISIDLPINHKLDFKSNRSTFYYYNSEQKFFKLKDPENTGEEENIFSDKRPEDARIFGPTGLVSVPQKISAGISADPELDIKDSKSNIDPEKSGNFLTKKYENSDLLKTGISFVPSPEERFKLPINFPFLIEKILVEIPIEVGPGWTRDRTVSSVATGDASYDNINWGFSQYSLDFAGPAITVALMNNRKDGGEPRELICKGTITHDKDVQKNISSKISWGKHLVDRNNIEERNIEPFWVFEPEGFAATGQVPDAIITPNENDTWSGTVHVPMTSFSSNGETFTSLTLVSPPKADQPDDANKKKSKLVKKFLSSKNIKITGADNSIFDQKFFLKTVDSFGKSSDGNFCASRSVFGNEISDLSLKFSEFENPFFLGPESQFPQPIKDFLDEQKNPSIKAVFHSTVPLVSKKESPYLVFPGDELTLVISKMRPAIASTLSTFGISPSEGDDLSPTKNRHGLEHEAKINPGLIKIKIFGAVLQEMKEANQTLDQRFLNSHIAETISSSPIVDQFEIGRTSEFFGAYTDDFFFQKDKNNILGKKKIFSKVSSNGEDILFPTDDYDLALPDYKSERIVRKKDLIGDQRTVRFFDQREIIFDSSTPALQDCFDVDGCRPAYIADIEKFFPNGSFDLDLASTSRESIFTTNVVKKYGFLLFDIPHQIVGNFLNFDPSEIINNSWNWSFPFEEKYSAVKRNFLKNKGFFSKREVLNLFEPVYDENDQIVYDPEDPQLALKSDISSSLKKVQINHFLPVKILRDNSGYSLDMFLDTNLNKENVWIRPVPPFLRTTYKRKESAKTEDLIKIMFGFGDLNTMTKIDFNGESFVAGHNHQPNFRLIESLDLPKDKFQPRTSSTSPVIRGWRYGLYSGISSNTSAVFRRGSYGQFRDMLEQRVFTKFFDFEQKIDLEGPVTVRFVDELDRTVNPLVTWAQNITKDASSSIPYFDEEARSRPPIDVNNLGTIISTLNI